MTTRRTASLALAGATAAVSVSAILIRVAEDDAGTVVWLRMALAVAVLMPWAIPQLRAGAVAATRRDALLTAAAGLLLAVHFLAWTASLAYTSVAASVLLVSVHPLIVTPLGARLTGDPVDRRLLFGIGVAVAGTAVTCAGAAGGGTRPLLGDLLALVGAVSLAGYLLIGRSRRALGGVVAYSAVVYTVVALAGVTVVAAGWTSAGLHAPSGRTLLACLALAVVSTIGGHTIFNWTLHRVPASAVSLAFLGEAPLAALLAFLLLGQRPGVGTLAGGTLILAGLAVTLASPQSIDPPGPVLTPAPRSEGRGDARARSPSAR